MVCQLPGYALRVTVFLAVAATVAARSESGLARPQFKNVWDEKYLLAGSKIRDALGEGGSCHVCHAGPSKKKRNAYGAALSELLARGDVNDTARILEALETVADQHSVAGDETSPTFGQLIAEGTLPIGGDEPPPRHRR